MVNNVNQNESNVTLRLRMSLKFCTRSSRAQVAYILAQISHEFETQDSGIFLNCRIPKFSDLIL